MITGIRYWGRVRIETPDQALNFLTKWLAQLPGHGLPSLGPQRLLPIRGAFGFRDQLQDVISLMHTEPGLLRAQILLNAFSPVQGRRCSALVASSAWPGVRTRCSDDSYGCPMMTCRYVTVTGDESILNEPMNFLEGRMLNADEESYYDLPGRSDQSADLYNHCVRAINHSLRFGAHGVTPDRNWRLERWYGTRWGRG